MAWYDHSRSDGLARWSRSLTARTDNHPYIATASRKSRCRSLSPSLIPDARTNSGLTSVVHRRLLQALGRAFLQHIAGRGSLGPHFAPRRQPSVCLSMPSMTCGTCVLSSMTNGQRLLPLRPSQGQADPGYRSPDRPCVAVCISTCAWAQLARMPISSCAWSS